VKESKTGHRSGLGITCARYVFTGIVPYDKLNVADPIAVGVDAIGLKWLAPIIKLGAILGLSSVILVSLLGQTRILYSMSNDGLLPLRPRHHHRSEPAAGCRRSAKRKRSRGRTRSCWTSA
jgi:amino acid transporter